MRKVIGNSKTFGWKWVDWTPGYWILDHLKMSASSSVHKNLLSKDESIKSTRNMQEAQPSCDQFKHS